MSNYLYEDFNGNKYEYTRLLGIAHETYCNECLRKGNVNVQGLTTKYPGMVISKLNDDGILIGCFKVPDDSLIDLPEVFHDKLKTLEEAQLDGWFQPLEPEG